MAQSSTSDTATKANGLLDRFQKGEVLLALRMVNKPLALLETLNAGLQARTATMSGMKSAVNTVMTELKELREATVFESIFTETSDLITKLDLNPLAVPRRRRPPARFTGPAAAHHAESAVEHFRMAYFQLVDGMMNNLSDRFGEGSKADLQDYQKLEEIITTGIVDQDILHKYPEFNTNLTAFKTQLDMFLHTSKATTIEGATRAYQNMSADVRALFPDVKSLLKLMLVCPVTSCECERSFSALRRLKTWLRSTMTQTRLNSCAVCNIHKLVLDDIDVVPLAAQFASRSETRKNMFGNFT
ncbi:52 kDa repressor of the inhibitor of the protein kinase-like [Amphiura filiformis]|uniref:52 kDa repressor of the inhibitor of the protein kinase-like n=1 Tax=Amphiura filiformis TaxID=82378 RepID=UPI003B222CD0